MKETEERAADKWKGLTGRQKSWDRKRWTIEQTDRNRWTCGIKEME
jgi:hypothetical protein